QPFQRPEADDFVGNLIDHFRDGLDGKDGPFLPQYREHFLTHSKTPLRRRETLEVDVGSPQKPRANPPSHAPRIDKGRHLQDTSPFPPAISRALPDALEDASPAA